MSTKPGETYLGDGLYASMEGPTLWLRAPRSGGDHEVALEYQVMHNMLEFYHSKQPELLATFLKGIVK